MFSPRAIKARLASSWICWRGTPVAKPKSKPSSVLTVGKPATRANISRASLARITLGAQDLFEKVGKGGGLGRGALSDRGIEIRDGAEPQFAGQLGQALILQIA